MAYVPANLYPMLRTRTIGYDQADTIIQGAIELMRHGAFGVGLVIIVASVFIPIAKFIAIAALARAVRRGARTSAENPPAHLRDRRIHRPLVDDRCLRGCDPDRARANSASWRRSNRARCLAFALSVIFTMFSAQAFDPRLIWDDPGPDAMPASSPASAAAAPAP